MAFLNAKRLAHGSALEQNEERAGPAAAWMSEKSLIPLSINLARIQERKTNNMRVTASLFSLAVFLAVFASSASADIVLTFGAPQMFTANTGVQSINVFAHSNVSAGESAISIGADFTLSGAAVFDTLNAGTFGGTGFIGNGNITLGTFDRDTNAGIGNTANLNIIFNSPQQITGVVTPLATLRVDTNGLAAGNYAINVSNGFFGLGKIADASSSFNIQISAVPEPTSIVLLGVAMGGVLGPRSLRKRRVV